jgi:Transcriptional regulator/sugar kinase
MQRVISEDMKQQNRIVIYKYIRQKDTQKVTRIETGRNTGISGPTVLKTFEYFANRGIILDEGALKRAEPGRRSSIYRFNPNAAFAVGVSYDGQMLRLSLVNLNYETVLQKSEPIQTSFSSLIRKTLPQRLSELIKGYGSILGAGISLPAIVDTEKRTIRFLPRSTKKTEMVKEDLSADCAELEHQMGFRVRLENNVNSAALAEYRVRNYGDNEDMVYIILGSGLGAGIILNGELRRGAHFTCGEIGYMLSGIKNTSSEETLGHTELEIYKHSLDNYGINLLTDSPKKFPDGLIQHTGNVLSLVITNLANSLDIPYFALGGFVYEKMGPVLLDEINRSLKETCLREVELTAALCEDGGASGAAALLIDSELESFLSDSYAVFSQGNNLRKKPDETR